MRPAGSLGSSSTRTYFWFWIRNRRRPPSSNGSPPRIRVAEEAQLSQTLDFDESLYRCYLTYRAISDRVAVVACEFLITRADSPPNRPWFSPYLPDGFLAGCYGLCDHPSLPASIAMKVNPEGFHPITPEATSMMPRQLSDVE